MTQFIADLLLIVGLNRRILQIMLVFDHGRFIMMDRFVEMNKVSVMFYFT
jgi:hypothetical protein